MGQTKHISVYSNAPLTCFFSFFCSSSASLSLCIKTEPFFIHFVFVCVCLTACVNLLSLHACIFETIKNIYLLYATANVKLRKVCRINHMRHSFVSTFGMHKHKTLNIHFNRLTFKTTPTPKSKVNFHLLLNNNRNAWNHHHYDIKATCSTLLYCLGVRLPLHYAAMPPNFRGVYWSNKSTYTPGNPQNGPTELYIQK